MSILRGRYAGSPETAFDVDIRQIEARGLASYAESVIEAGGRAKPYQVKQVRQVILKYSVAGRYPMATPIRVASRPEHRYELIVYWSDPDEAFIVEVPELAGCMADGATYTEAVASTEVVIRKWIDLARELGRPIPEPRGRLFFA